MKIHKKIKAMVQENRNLKFQLNDLRAEVSELKNQKQMGEESASRLKILVKTLEHNRRYHLDTQRYEEEIEDILRDRPVPDTWRVMSETLLSTFKQVEVAIKK